MLENFQWNVTCLKIRTRKDAYVITPVIAIAENMGLIWSNADELSGGSCCFSIVRVFRDKFPKLAASHLSSSPAPRILQFWCLLLIMEISFNAIILIFCNFELTYVVDRKPWQRWEIYWLFGQYAELCKKCLFEGYVLWALIVVMEIEFLIQLWIHSCHYIYSLLWLMAFIIEN